MITPYIQNLNCYIISSFADSNNPLFTDEQEIKNFKQRVQKYLGELCEILGYSFHTDHYQLLVIIKDRESFVKFFNEKHGESLTEEQVMDSTYIFSLQIANMLSGFAKKFNFRHKRYGTLFGRRFTKILVETEEEIQNWVERMNRAERLWNFEKLWSYMWNFVKRLKQLKRIKVGLGVRTEAERLGAVVDEVFGVMLISWESFQLRGGYVVAPLPPHLAEKLLKKP